MKASSLVPALVIAAFAAPAAVSAQAAPAQLPDSVQRMVRQLEVLEGRLGPIEANALAVAPELTEMSAGIQSDVVAKMVELFPSLETGMDRLVAMNDSLATAQQAANIPRVTELMNRGQMLNDSIVFARDEALRVPDLRERLVAYQEALVEKMKEIDPTAAAIIDEMNALTARIDAADIGGGN